MGLIPDHELVSRAQAWLESLGLEVDRTLAVDRKAPVRLKDPDYGGKRTICVWINSEKNLASFFNHHGGSGGYSYLDTRDEWLSMSPEERQKAEAERLKKMDARRAAELEGYEQAAKKAQDALAKAADAPADFPYFVRKQVVPCKGLKLGKAWRPKASLADGTEVPGHEEPAILMPLQDLNGRVWSYQAVFSDGFHSKLMPACGSLYSCHENSILFVMLQSSGLTMPA